MLPPTRWWEPRSWTSLTLLESNTKGLGMSNNIFEENFKTTWISGECVAIYPFKQLKSIGNNINLKIINHQPFQDKKNWINSQSIFNGTFIGRRNPDGSGKTPGSDAGSTIRWFPRPQDAGVREFKQDAQTAATEGVTTVDQLLRCSISLKL